MPVEIREIIITMDVSSPQGSGANPAGGGGADQSELIRTCVEKVMELLEQQKQR
jgi:hypothetical protein